MKNQVRPRLLIFRWRRGKATQASWVSRREMMSQEHARPRKIFWRSIKASRRHPKPEWQNSEFSTLASWSTHHESRQFSIQNQTSFMNQVNQRVIYCFKMDSVRTQSLKIWRTHLSEEQLEKFSFGLWEVVLLSRSLNASPSDQSNSTSRPKISHHDTRDFTPLLKNDAYDKRLHNLAKNDAWSKIFEK